MSDTEIRRYYDQSYPPSLWGGGGTEPPPSGNSGTGVLTLFGTDAEIRGDFAGVVPPNGVLTSMVINGTDIGPQRTWHTVQSGTWVGAIGTGVTVWVHASNADGVSNLDFLTALSGQTVTVEWTPIPLTLESITPDENPYYSRVTITARGTGFSDASLIYVGTQSYITELVSSTEIRMTTDGNTPPGWAVGPINVKVANPAAESNVLTLTVTPIPDPVLAALAPNTASAAVGGNIAMTLTGTDFVEGMSLHLGPIYTAATLVSATEATASFPLSSLTEGAHSAETYIGAESAGFKSNPLPFTVTP
jgi:hypothetical protein